MCRQTFERDLSVYNTNLLSLGECFLLFWDGLGDAKGEVRAQDMEERRLFALSLAFCALVFATEARAD